MATHCCSSLDNIVFFFGQNIQKIFKKKIFKVLKYLITTLLNGNAPLQFTGQYSILFFGKTIKEIYIFFTQKSSKYSKYPPLSQMALDNIQNIYHTIFNNSVSVKVNQLIQLQILRWQCCLLKMIE